MSFRFYLFVFYCKIKRYFHLSGIEGKLEKLDCINCQPLKKETWERKENHETHKTKL